MYKIELRRRVQRSLDKLPGADYKAVIQAILVPVVQVQVKELAETPRPRGIEKVRSTGLWRIRQGDYRIIYAIDDNEHLVTVVRVGNRREIYRSL